MVSAVAVTGTGVVTAAGRGVDAAWEALCAGQCLVAPDADPELGGFSPIASARCARLTPESLGVDRRAARIMGGQTHFLVASVTDALSEASGGGGCIRGDETAFFAGIDSVDLGTDDLASAALISKKGDGAVDYGEFFREGMSQVPPLWPLSMVNAIGFCQVAIQFGLRGENATFSPGPESAARAVIEAAESIREGKSKAALAAGVSTVISARAIARYRTRGFLRQAPGMEAELMEPFSGRGGVALGEGSGIVFMESLEFARQGGKSIGGILEGWGWATAVPEVNPLADAIRVAAEKALEAAGVPTSKVDLVIPHGGGNREEDAAEVEAIMKLFGTRRPHALATKGAFGHMLGGSPLVDLVLAVRVLREGTVPPSPGVGEQAHSVLDFPVCPVRAENLRNALILSRGFDGACMAFAVGAA